MLIRANEQLFVPLFLSMPDREDMSSSKYVCLFVFDKFTLHTEACLLLSLSSGWGTWQFCPVSPGGPQLVPQEVSHLRGDPHLPASYPVSAGGRPLLRHLPARAGRPGLQQQLLPQTLVALLGCGRQQRPWRLCAVLRSVKIWAPGQRQHTTVCHEDSNQSGGWDPLFFRKKKIKKSA